MIGTMISVSAYENVHNALIVHVCNLGKFELTIKKIIIKEINVFLEITVFVPDHRQLKGS